MQAGNRGTPPETPLNLSMHPPPTRYKPWIVLFAGIILQTAIGGIYAWSTFVPVLVEEHGFSRAQTGLIFGVQVLMFSVTTIPAGRLLGRFGPRATAGAGALLFGAGYLLASLAGDSFTALLLAIGGVTGAGLGLVYVCPLTTGMKWFPQHRGLVTGAAVAGFGLGAIFLSQFAEYFLVVREVSVHGVFRLIGLVFGGTAVAAAYFLDVPRTLGEITVASSRQNWSRHLRSPVFLILALGIFSGTFAGLLVSAHLKPYLLYTGADEAMAVLAISIFAVGNATGRLAWGFIHDRCGSRLTILMSLGALLVTLLGMVATTVLKSDGLVPILIIIIGFGFGGCFVIYVSAITHVFGVDLMPRLYPFCFVCYGLAALIGPATGGWLVDVSGSYTLAFLLCASLVGVALAAVARSSGHHWAKVF
jgi:OFA family oxalate/formate antiporter-like MFS transporter